MTYWEEGLDHKVTPSMPPVMNLCRNSWNLVCWTVFMLYEITYKLL